MAVPNSQMYFSQNNKNGLKAATILYLFMKIVNILESVVLDILKYCLFQRNVFFEKSIQHMAHN